MATIEEKKKELAKLLDSSGRGKELAESVFQAAAQKEAQAIEMGLKYKELRAGAAPFANVPDYRGNPQTGIGAVLRG